MKASFQRIARSTKNEAALEDLHHEAWILAVNIGNKRGRSIDFSNADDQRLVIGAVHARFVKWGEWQLRNAVRIDQEDDQDVTDWHDRLPADATSDPLVSLLMHEAALGSMEQLRSSYSQAVAYFSFFAGFRNDREKICAYLAISREVLSKRVAVAASTVRKQASLFDRIEKISDQALPAAGQRFIRKEKFTYPAVQYPFDFS